MKKERALTIRRPRIALLGPKEILPTDQDGVGGQCVIRSAQKLEGQPAKERAHFEEGLSGKGGLAGCQGLTRFQSLPFRTAREDFPQAAHPVPFAKRVM